MACLEEGEARALERKILWQHAQERGELGAQHCRFPRFLKQPLFAPHRSESTRSYRRISGSAGGKAPSSAPAPHSSATPEDLPLSKAPSPAPVPMPRRFAPVGTR